MRKMIIGGFLAGILIICGCFAALGEAASTETADPALEPVTAEEILALVDRVRLLAEQMPILNDPTQPEAASEDGYALQYDFGVIYADQPAWSAETKINAILIMDGEVPGPREVSIDWTVNGVMNAIPCENGEMYGNYEESALYLTGDAEGGFLYGLVQRDGQRISAMEYGAADGETGNRISLVLGISGDGVAAMRVEGLQERDSAEELAELYSHLEELGHQYLYYRVPRSLDGTELEMFNEADLDFSALSFRTALPEIFGDNVEDMLIDNEDGTWLRRVDGEGFEAVFSCDARGNHASILSFQILSPDLEGPRFVRLGDLFHEDFTRFRSGEGELSEDGSFEVLYGTVGTAPYGTAEYGDGTEMTLRYVTPTLGGPDVELVLRYQNTVLTEMILHTVEEDE